MKQLHIAYDSREQQPLHHWGEDVLHGSTEITWHRAALETFDYCVWRDWIPLTKEVVRPTWAIERKSVADFISSWFNAEKKRRECDKIKRAERWFPRPIVYVVEGDMADIAQYDYRRFPSGKVTAQAVESRINRLRYAGVQVIMSGGRLMAEYDIVSLLKRRAGELGVRACRKMWEHASEEEER